MSEYNRQAEAIESMLREHYPKLNWRVYRDEDTCDDPRDFYKFDWRFEIWCRIPGMDWRARHFLERKVWEWDGERLVHMLGAAFAGHITAHFLGGLGEGEEDASGE